MKKKKKKKGWWKRKVTLHRRHGIFSVPIFVSICLCPLKPFRSGCKDEVHVDPTYLFNLVLSISPIASPFLPSASLVRHF